MFGSSILEVAIGIVFVYLLMSFLCSAVNEIVESVLRNRATDLENGVWNLLNQGKGAPHLAKQLYDHPLVNGLFNGSYRRGAKKPVRRRDYLMPTNLPSYIPARNFAQALIDIALHPPAKDGEAAPADEAAAAQPVTMEAVRSALQKSLGDTEAGRALRTLAGQSGEDVEAFRLSVERWFDSAMDRVSGAYTRRTKWIVFGMGLVLTVFLNVNTITVARALANDHTMRELIVARAETYTGSRAEAQGDAAGAAAAADAPKRDYESAKRDFEDGKKELAGLGLPIGWPNDFHLVLPWYDGFNAYNNVWLPLIGWLLTAGAISLGAPFWFDMLNKFMIIRSTVKPHEKSPEEASND